MRLIEASFPEAYLKDVAKAAARAEPIHWRIGAPGSDDTRQLHALCAAGGGQALIDALQSIFQDVEGWRLVVLPVDATVPAVADPISDEEKKKRKRIAIREEIYQDVSEGAALTPDFLVLTFLSTVVAAIGLNSNNVAVVIGAMVIAPLLGPILAFAFGAALGEFKLMVSSAKTALSGLALGLVVSYGIGAVFGADLNSGELTSRAVVGLDSVALALASGGAAALSIVAGLSAALVGVMVAVALLPPAAAVGLFLGAGSVELALGAALLLGVNVVCVNLAALSVFSFKGVRPRTWLERKTAKRSVRVYLAVWAVLLAGLVALTLIYAA